MRVSRPLNRVHTRFIFACHDLQLARVHNTANNSKQGMIMLKVFTKIPEQLPLRAIHMPSVLEIL